MVTRFTGEYPPSKLCAHHNYILCMLYLIKSFKRNFSVDKCMILVVHLYFLLIFLCSCLILLLAETLLHVLLLKTVSLPLFMQSEWGYLPFQLPPVVHSKLLEKDRGHAAALGLLSSRCNSCFLTKLETQQKKRESLANEMRLRMGWDGQPRVGSWGQRGELATGQRAMSCDDCMSHKKASAPGRFAHMPWNHHSFLNWHPKVFKSNFNLFL